MEDNEESDKLNQNFLEGINEVPSESNNPPQMESVINDNDIINKSNNVLYENQPNLNEQITSKLSLNDLIKIEYSQAIFSDFEKIIQYDSLTNQFKPGLDDNLAYPYHFNPTLLSLIRYIRCCDCCDSDGNDIPCCELLKQNNICAKILLVFNLLLRVNSIYAFLSLISLPIFIRSIIFFFDEPGVSFFLVLFIYAMGLFFQYQLLYYKLPQSIDINEFRKKIQQKMQTGQRIYFGDDKKVVPLVYHSYFDISGTLELTKPYNLVVFSGRPGTYFLDGKTIKEFYKLDEEFRLRGGNQRYYINYEQSPSALNTKIDYENQTLNSMFSSHEKNELFIQDDELLYLAPQGFKKWDRIPLICFFCLVGVVYNNFFELNLEFKSYKVRKALFFEEPDKEIEEKLYKYSPKVTYQGNLFEFEQHSDKIDQNLIKPYFEKWDENYNEKNNQEFI